MIYVCGDSFGVPDADYGAMWVDLLAQRLGEPVTNLSRVCANNAMIAQQVDCTVNADFVIVLFTASTRAWTRQNNQVVSFSWHSLDHTTPFDSRQLSILKNYAVEFFDLDLAIYENQCIIESVLQRLVDRGQRFCFDQGGFEHASYGSRVKYFGKYSAWRSEINCWDWAQHRSYRPYYHITDSAVHHQIADYYFERIRGHS
jgi:hypothetical protein